MSVDPEFQRKILAQIAAAKAAGGTGLDISFIKHADEEATAWVITQINDEDDGLPLLTTLNLWGNQIGEAGARAIAQNMPLLTMLDLSSNQIGDAGARAIAQHLPRLTTLDLSDNQIGDAGARAIAQAIDAGHFPSLTHLVLYENNLPVDAAVLESHDPVQIAAAILGGVILPAARIMFLGMGDVGKTRLAKRCFEHEFTVDGDRHERTTDFNLVDPTQCKFIPQITLRGREQKITPYVWDFGGQPELHGLHEAFLGDRPGEWDDEDSRMGIPARPSLGADADGQAALTPGPSPRGRGGQRPDSESPATIGRSVYVLVLAADKVPGSRIDNPNLWDEKGNNLPYWLKMLHHHAGPDAPVVIAITRCDTPDGKRAKGQRPVDQRVEVVERVHLPVLPTSGDVGGWEGRPGKAVLRDGRAIGPVLRTIVVTEMQLDEFRRYGVNVVAVVDGCSATEGETPSEKRQLLAANQRLEEAITAALRVIEKPLAASVPPKIVTLIEAVEPDLRLLPYISFNHFQQLCQKCEIGDENDRPGVLNSLQQSSLRILDGLGVLFFFGKTDYEQKMLAEKNPEYRSRLTPGRERFERLQTDSLLKQTLLNPRWIKKAAYEIAEASTRTVEFQQQAFHEYVQRANALITGDAESPVSRNELTLIQEFMKLSGLCWEVDGTFHFPRGFPEKKLERIDDWPMATLSWQFLPESAFFRYVVEVRTNPQYDLTGIEQCRHAVLIKLKGIRLAVTAEVSNDLLEIRFDPQSDRDQWPARVETIADKFSELVRGTPRVDLSGLKGSEISAKVSSSPMSEERQPPWVQLAGRILEKLVPESPEGKMWQVLWGRWLADYPDGPEPEPESKYQKKGWAKYAAIIDVVWGASGSTNSNVQKLKGKLESSLSVTLQTLGYQSGDIQIDSGARGFHKEEYRLKVAMACCQATSGK